MKIDRKNPQHLKALAVSGLFTAVAIAVRPFVKRKKSKEKIIVFYGHTLNGNLKAFFDYLANRPGYSPYFLVLDEPYFKRLLKEVEYPNRILNSLKLKDMIKVGCADAFITSHGLHFFSPLRRLTSIKFIDVWHAVSYKGFGEKEFNHLHAHDEIWVSSKAMKKLYKDRYGFKSNKVIVTGYGRTDLLITSRQDKKSIISKYGLPMAKKYVLIAPTWAQDVHDRSLLPFGVEPNVFFEKLDVMAGKHSAHIIFRTHLNSGDAIRVSGLKHTSFMPYSRYEVVEDFLNLADILITDWSSIGIDYLPLKRPTIFLDVPAPFKNGFNLGPEHRFGDVVENFEDLLVKLEANLSNPERFINKYESKINDTINEAYGTTLDGKSRERYLARLNKLLS